MEKWQDSDVIKSWIALSILVMIVLVGFIILFVFLSIKRMIHQRLQESTNLLIYEKSLLENSIMTQDRERKRIAADLHDELIGKLLAAQLKNMLPDQQEDLSQLLTDSIATARRVSHDLSPPMSEHTSLSELISELMVPWSQAFTVIYTRDIRSGKDFSKQVKIQFLRIVQEWISNIVKHAAAKEIRIHYRHTEKCFSLQICDNGCGFDSGMAASGLGLKNIEMRMHYLEGHYKVKSTRDKGTSALFLLKPSKSESL